MERGYAQLDMVSQMNIPSESRKEARDRKTQLLTTKSTTRIGTWNVRTLYSTGKLAQVINEMRRYNLDVLGISEMRWTDSGKMDSDGISIFYSGGSKHERGVGIMLTAVNSANCDLMGTSFRQDHNSQTTGKILQCIANPGVCTNERCKRRGQRPVL